MRSQEWNSNDPWGCYTPFQILIDYLHFCFENGLLVDWMTLFWSDSFLSPSWISDPSPLSDCIAGKDFLLAAGCVHTAISFAAHPFISVSLSLPLFLGPGESFTESPCPRLHCIVFSLFSSSNFKVLGLTLKSLILWVDLLRGMRKKNLVSSFSMWIFSFPSPLVKEDPYSNLCF